jgi:hypothetical protein
MKNIRFSHRQELLETAKSLIKQGFSIIPVYGDSHPNQPKKPATLWGKYQKRLANPHEITTWFTQDITAIGIICGKISNLLVIDFDDHFTYMQFRKDHPTFAETFTVKTRRGYHLYFEAHQYITSHHFDGGDIKGEKSYIIASPSIINGYRYKVLNNIAHKKLLPYQLDKIFNYFQINTQTRKLPTTDQTTTQLDLLTLYDNLMPQLGRNNALYRTASIARHNGINQLQAEQTLIYHHIEQPTPNNHKQETPKERYHEGQRTIRSAYNAFTKAHIPSIGIPNSIREALLDQSTIFARLLDIFHLAKWKPHTLFSMSNAIKLCQQYGLNRKSVMQALTGNLSKVNEKDIIVRRHVEYPDNRGLNSHESGRPSKISFEVPSMSHLLNVLNVRWSPSDVITVEDVKNAHSYRLALHREYIKRISPQVPLWWLARRIGVDVRTIQRYNLELDVQITQNLGCFTLSKSNLDTLPKRHREVVKNATNGFWLETGEGKRYPAWRHIGSQLLKSHPISVTVCIQKPSKLTLSNEPSDVESVIWHEVTPSSFVKTQAFRECVDERPKLSQVVDNLLRYVKKRVDKVRYLSMKLHFDSVINYIAKDDVAETITSYLYAYDEDGNRVHRPAKRGIAYRMLKEFGNGNVYLALLDLHTETWYALARHAVRFDELPTAMKFLLSALD